MRDITVHLALLAGGYLAVTGLGLMVSTRFYRSATAGPGGTDGVSLNLSGAVHFLAGATLLLKHTYWDGPVEIAVTLIGAAALAKGVALIVIPERTPTASQGSPVVLRLTGLVFLALGAWLGVSGLASGWR